MTIETAKFLINIYTKENSNYRWHIMDFNDTYWIYCMDSNGCLMWAYNDDILVAKPLNNKLLNLVLGME